MRVYFVFLNLCFASLVWANSQRQGQETWGGDTAALKFVKIGRMLSHEFKKSGDCNLPNSSWVKNWDEVLESTIVESTEVDLEDRPGQIYFNRYKWWDLRSDWKTEIVLKKYLSQFSKKLADAEIEKIAKKCLLSKFWIRISNPKAVELQKREPLNDIKHISQDLLSQIKDNEIRNLPKDFDIKKMKNIIENLDLSVKPKSETYTEFDVTPVTILFPEGRLKDAQNIVSTEKISLTINRHSWGLLSRGQKKELLLHEFLGLMRIADQAYQFSSKLMFDLEDKEYEEK